MKKLLVCLFRYMTMRYGRMVSYYLKYGDPNGREWGEYLRKHGGLYAMGENCLIEATAKISNPGFLRLGNNVHLSACRIIGHDGSIGMLGRRYGLKLDRVGKIDIRDNVFIGAGAIILPNVVIGPDAIVAAGSVVTKDVAENSVVGGVPAKPIGKTSELALKWREETLKLPWAHLIEQRIGAYDPELEPELNRLRVKLFFEGE